MATTQTKTSAASIDGMFERATQAQEQFAAAATKAGQRVPGLLREGRRPRLDDRSSSSPASTQQDWIKSIAETQADFARELTNTYTSTARTLLK